MSEKNSHYGIIGAIIGGIIVGLAGCKSCLDVHDETGKLWDDFNLLSGMVYGAIGGWLIGVILAYNEDHTEIVKRKMREEEYRKWRAEQIVKEKEIGRRNDIIANLININYKKTETEVNKTLIPTLLNELYSIYNGLHSDNLKDLVTNGSRSDFERITNAVKLELDRLIHLALEAQARGFNNFEYNFEKDLEKDLMSKEKAFQILGVTMNATKEKLKQAYRELAKKYHTDKRDKIEEHIKHMLEDKMKEINSAKEYLKKMDLYD